jgi:hypothetical protein
MTLDSFKVRPWQTPHESYLRAASLVSPAPEYANSDVIVASLCRVIGLPGHSEGTVPLSGRALERRIKERIDKNERPEGAAVEAETWQSVLHGALESPKLPNQSSSRFLQVTPLVPEFARYSGSARLAGNPWTPGALVRKMVWLGATSEEAAESLWRDLFEALSVSGHDDIFARWLESESRAWNDQGGVEWMPTDIRLAEGARFAEEDINDRPYPARQFARDLGAIILAKKSITRRQWVSMLDAVVRLATATHVLWLCDVQSRIWACIDAVLDGAAPGDEAAVRDKMFPQALQYITYGDKALEGMKDRVSGYLLARLGINGVLWMLQEAGHGIKADLSTAGGVARFCEHVWNNRDQLAAAGVRDLLGQVGEQEARALLCKKGIGSNMIEFMTHVLGQRQSALDLLRGYDQGYVLKKKSKRAPWVASLGPVSAIAFVHCALSGTNGPRSIHRLSQHLASYGMTIGRHHISASDLGQELRMLGLVLDSPDAESGMLLRQPFPA